MVKGLTIPPGSYVGLTVTDTGTGIDPETQEHLFEPFFTTKGEKGTGLGLATVWGIVNQWEGYIWLYSSPGIGTTFSIYFPAIGNLVVADEKPAVLSLAAHGTETILVAEDEEPLRKIMVRALEKYGYHVLQAGNGLEAIQEAMKYKDPIQLLLTDTVMPKMNGKVLAGELKISRPRYPCPFHVGISDGGPFQPGFDNDFTPLDPKALFERDAGAAGPGCVGPKMRSAEPRDRHGTRSRSVGLDWDQIADVFIDTLYQTAFLHDIGKVGEPNSILTQWTPLGPWKSNSNGPTRDGE